MIRTDATDAGNDEKFFVFLEVVEKLMLYFTRDSYVNKNCVVTAHPNINAL